MKTIRIKIELKLSVTDKVAEQITKDLKDRKEFAWQPAFSKERILLEKIDQNGVVIDRDTASVKSVEFVDYTPPQYNP